MLEWLNEPAVGALQVRGMKALLGTAVTAGGSAVDTACGDCVVGAAGRLVRAARRGDAAGDVELIEVLRLVHGVVTASESTDGVGQGMPGSLVRRYLSLVWGGLRA